MRSSGVRRSQGPWTALFVAALAVLAACGESPTGVVFEVIEDTEFAASLNVDLAAMERLSNGVYVEVLTEGSGAQVVLGTTVSIDYTLWLSDGSEVQAGADEFLMGNNAVVSGLEDGILGKLVGTTVRIIMPANHGYGRLPVEWP